MDKDLEYYTISNNKKNSNENRNTFGKNLVTNMRLINLMAKIKDTIDTNKKTSYEGIKLSI